ncbi:DUF3857 domain-containing protein [Anaeromyxobacter paludicola]|uniref:DUF3857 domain-containing protein n=1 Tax=Anaeromyxobacter paludicola TaxID=2918171 RepID=UPI0020BE3B7D|nr:DUF3857 domain-containing protein [Anaeromyxobacter paludicola]
MRLRPLAFAVLLSVAAACAGARPRSPLDEAAARAAAPDAPARTLAQAGWHALLASDPGLAAARFRAAVAREPAEPWALEGLSLLDRRGLDDAAEARHLLALVAGAPRHALAEPAVRRLSDLADRGPARAAEVEAGLAPLLARGALAGNAASRARLALAGLAQERGDPDRAAALRAEAGVVRAWTLSGPWGAWHALDLDRPFLPEAGPLPASAEGPPGVGALAARTLLAPSGLATLEGEPYQGDQFYLAADVTAARGGAYLVNLGSTALLRAWLDGELVAERRPGADAPTLLTVRRALSPGVHRLLVKLGRGPARAVLAASFAREDGAPSDLAVAPAATGPGPAAAPARPGPASPPPPRGLSLARALEPDVGPAAARLVAARDALPFHREEAKALLLEALAAAPGAAPLHAARAEALRDDSTLADRVARSRAEAELDRALAADPGDAESRLARAELARAGERLDAVAEVLQALPAEAARAPAALLARARLEQARGVTEAAERLAEEAREGGGSCEATPLLLELANRRDAVARADELARALPGCPGGRERLAEHLRLRGRGAEELALRERLQREEPSRIEPALALARALSREGAPRRAAELLAGLGRTWPREARLEKRRAEALDLAGDAAAARAARARAAALDGGDLALRRAAALDEGRDLLAEYAEDGREAIRAYRASGARHDTSAVMVLDATAVLADARGASVERVHQVLQLLDQRAVDAMGEVSIPSGAQVIALRTLKADGRVLEPEEGGDRRSVSLPGLEPGDFAEWEYVRAVPSRGPGVPGFSTPAFLFRGEVPIWRSRFVVAAPAGSGLAADVRRIAAPAVAREGDREVLRLEARDVPALQPEPGTPAETEFLPVAQGGAGGGLDDALRGFADLLLARDVPSLEVRLLAREVAASVPAGARRDPLALARAAWARVHEVVVAPGSPVDSAGEVLSRGRGSRAVLLRALLRELGLDARFAVARDFTRDPSPWRFPRLELWSHTLLRLSAGGRELWLDPTVRYTPFGELPDALRGAEVVVLPEPGAPLVRARIPEGPRAPARSVSLDVTVDAKGDAEVAGEEVYEGFEGAAVKASFERLDAPQRRQALEQALSRSFRGLALTSFEVSGEGRLDQPFTIRYRLRAPGWARREDGRLVAESSIFPARLATRYLSRAEREAPLLVGSSERATLRVTVHAPPGYEPAPGVPRAVTSRFGSYLRTERSEGPLLVREDRLELPLLRVDPPAWTDFAAFARGVDAAQDRPLALVGAGTRSGDE